MFIKIKSSFQYVNKNGRVCCQSMSQTFLHKVTKYSSLQSNYFMTLLDTDDNLVLSHCQVVCKVGKDLSAKGRFSTAMIRPA
jgi:hypothetical protein